MAREMTVLQGAFLGVSMGDREGAADLLVESVVAFAGECIPDLHPVQDALVAWGIAFEKGEPIQKLFGSTPSLKVVLPPGWSISHRGGGGHVELLDVTGAARLRWHLHGWDPAVLSVNRRFLVRVAELSATEGVAQVIDGTTVIHTISIRYPHARIFDVDGRFFRDGWKEDGWTPQMGQSNYLSREVACDAGWIWLDEHRPGHRDAIRSWSL